MSIARMRRRFSVHMKKILWVIIAVFVVGIPAYFGGLGRGGRDERRQAGEPPKVIAVINGEDFTRAMLDDAFVRQYQRLSAGWRHLPLQQITDVRLQGYDRAVSEMLQLQEARRRKLEPTEKQITAKINERTQQDLESIRNRAAQLDPPQKTTDVMKNIMRSYGEKVDRVTEAEFERWYKRWLREKERLASIKEELVLDRLETDVTKNINPTWEDMVAFYEQDMSIQEIQFRIKSELDPPEARTYPKAEVEKVAKRVAARAREGEDFTKLVMEYSSDTMATEGIGGDETRATKGISGFQNIAVWFRSRYSSTLAKEAPKYKVGQIVGPVESKGLKCYFVFKVLEKRKDPPEWLKDEENRKQYLRNFRDQERRRAFDDFKAELLEKAEIVVKDPEIRAERLMRDREYKQAAKEFNAALQDLLPWYGSLPDRAVLPLPALVPGAIQYSLGHMEQQKQNWKKAKEYYEAGVGLVSHDVSYAADMYFGLAHNEWLWMTAIAEPGPEKEERKQATLRWLEVMVRVAPEYSAGRENAIWIYDALGRRDLSVEHRLWLADHYVQPGLDQDKGMALRHREALLKYYQDKGDQESADDQQQKIDALKKEMEEESRAAPPGGAPGPGGITVTPVPAQ